MINIWKKKYFYEFKWYIFSNLSANNDFCLKTLEYSLCYTTFAIMKMFLGQCSILFTPEKYHKDKSMWRWQLISHLTQTVFQTLSKISRFKFTCLSFISNILLVQFWQLLSFKINHHAINMLNSNYRNCIQQARRW